MATAERDRYEFRHQALVELRSRLGLKQAAMAEALGVPQNTLSRWETGATPPDAKSLARFYSIAQEREEEVEFFMRKRPAPKLVKGKAKSRPRLLVAWDFQNTGQKKSQVKEINSRIRKAIAKRFPETSHQAYSAFGGVNQSAATDALANLAWRVWEDQKDIDKELIRQVKDYCAQEPQETAVVLICNDGDYDAGLTKELQRDGVEFYVGDLDGKVSERLRKAVSTNHVIDLRNG